jgi:wee1-like protein kinase
MLPHSAGSRVAAAASSAPPQVVYKIGDMGHVTPLDTPQPVHGDVRYVALEVFQGEGGVDLARGDIFALGLSLYELARGTPLDSAGDEWQALRAGQVQRLPAYSDELNGWLQVRARPPHHGCRGNASVWCRD